VGGALAAGTGAGDAELAWRVCRTGSESEDDDSARFKAGAVAAAGSGASGALGLPPGAGSRTVAADDGAPDDGAPAGGAAGAEGVGALALALAAAAFSPAFCRASITSAAAP